MNARKFTALGPSYNEIKNKLFDQYEKPNFDDSTGLSRDELIAGFNAIAAKDGSMSRMELRSRLFAFVMKNARIDVDPEDWDVCLPGALTLYGRSMTAEETLGRLLEDRTFYQKSGGGVTFSGGEPLLQSDFLAEILQMLKKENIHTAVDTCGDVPWQHFETVLPFTDLFLYDIKHMDEALHIRGTGRSNERILANLKALAARKAAVEIRTPVIPGYNDAPAQLEAIARLLAGMDNITVWRILPYHSMAKGKYEALGMAYPMPDTDMPNTVRMRELQESLAHIFPRVMLSSD